MIDENFSCVSVEFLLNEDATIKIGKDNMFSAAIKIWGSDGHGIIDINNKVVINRSKGVQIGDHVWICENVRILKNTKIDNNVVVANSALMVGSYDETNVIYGGNPAKVIKRNVDWCRESPISNLYTLNDR